MKLPEVVETIAEMSRIIEEIGKDMEGDFKVRMNSLEEQFSLLTVHMNKFSSSAAEELLIERLKYILKRGFK